MFPRTNFQLARVFGIRIGVGFSWFVVLFFFIILVNPYFHEVLGGSNVTSYVVTVASVLSFFVSLILHELGHALVARRNGLTVAGIDLWAFGGITRASAPTTPGMEFRVASAGPAVTLIVIVICVAVAGLLSDSKSFFDAAVAERGVHTTPALAWLSWLAAINALVLIFNLIPAFPLDGGGSRSRSSGGSPATATARRARPAGRGRLFALLLGVLGLVALASRNELGLLTLLLAFFLYQAASQAVVQAAVGQRIHSITVADVMDREPVTVPAAATLLDAREQFFWRYRWPWFAVVDPTGHFLGVVRGARVEEEISAGRPALAVSDVLEEDMQVRIDEAQPLESLLGSEGLGRLGAMVAVDDDGVLQGVVTIADVRRALRVAT